MKQMSALLPDERLDSSFAAASRLWRGAVGLCLALMLAALWLLTHRVFALSKDAQIYAFQALARVHPALLTDLFFQQSSQDRYTIFPTLYAPVIEWLGARNASVCLELLFSAALIGAAWALARRLFGPNLAWACAGMLTIAAGAYGAYAVFHIFDGFLTARLPAEVLIVAAIAAQAGGHRLPSLALTAAAFAFHPLMALPGFLLLLYLWAPTAIGLAGALVGVLACLCLSVAAPRFAALNSLFPLMDAAWLEVVQERSQFLFLQFWTLADWEANARPFLCVILSALVLPDPRLRKLCAGALVVGAAGLAIALVSSTIGPLAILLQGQPWRWVWCTELTALLALVPTALRAWREPRVGPLIAVALLASWTFSEIDPVLLAGSALALWLLRSFVDARIGRMLEWSALALSVGIVAWTVANAWTELHTVQVTNAREPATVLAARNLLGLGVPALAVALLLPAWLLRTRGSAVPLIVGAGLAAAILYGGPSAMRDNRAIGTAAQIQEFADWRAAIDPSRSVFVADGRNEGSFVWFTLERPNYLSMGQSAGAVFSEAAAAEIRRRSAVLEPVMDPDWRVLTSLRREHGGKPAPATERPLTAAGLERVCTDPKLGFVISKETLAGLAPLRHEHAGEWQNWNLYDCRRIRAAEPRA